MFMRAGCFKLAPDGDFNKNMESILEDNYTKRRLEFLEAKLNKVCIDIEEAIELKLICENCGSDKIKTVLNMEKFVSKLTDSEGTSDINGDVKEVLTFVANALRKKRALNIDEYLTEVVELKLLKLKNTLSTNNKGPVSDKDAPKSEIAKPFDLKTSKPADFEKQVNFNSITNFFGNIFGNYASLGGISLVFDGSKISIIQLAQPERKSPKPLSIVEVPKPETAPPEKTTLDICLPEMTEEKETKITELEADNSEKELVISECEDEEITVSEDSAEYQKSEYKIDPPPEPILSPNKREIKEALTKFRACVENFLLPDSDETKHVNHFNIEDETNTSHPNKVKKVKYDKLVTEAELNSRRLLEMKVKRQKEKEKKMYQEKIKTQCAKGTFAPMSANSMTSLPLSNKTFYTSIFGANVTKGPKQKTIFSANPKRKVKEPGRDVVNYDRSHSINRCTILETISDCKEDESVVDDASPTQSMSKKTLLIKIPSVESCTSKQHINRNINRNIKTECRKNVEKIYNLIDMPRSPTHCGRYSSREVSPEPGGSKDTKHSKSKTSKVKRYERAKYETFDEERPSVDSITYRLEEKKHLIEKRARKCQQRRIVSPNRDEWNSFYVEEGRRSPNRRLDALAQPKKSYVEANSEMLRKKAMRCVEIDGKTSRINACRRQLVNSDSYTTSESVTGSSHSKRKTTDTETLKQVKNSSKTSLFSTVGNRMSQNFKQKLDAHIRAGTFSKVDFSAKTNEETLVDHDDNKPRNGEKYACGEGVDILFKKDNLKPKPLRKDMTKKNIRLGKVHGNGNNPSALTYKPIDNSATKYLCDQNISKEYEAKILLQTLEKTLKEIELKKLQSVQEFYSMFWPAGDATLSRVAQPFDFGSYFIAPTITVAYSFPAQSHNTANISVVETVRRQVEHDIPTEIYNRSLPNNESPENNNFESASEVSKPNNADPDKKTMLVSSKTAEAGNECLENVSIQTRCPLYADKDIYVDFPEKEFISTCVNAQSVFLKPEYLKNHPSLEDLFREGSKILNARMSDQNLTTAISKMSAIKKISMQNVNPVESHPLIEMFNRSMIKRKRMMKPYKFKKQKRSFSNHIRVPLKQRPVYNIKKNLLLAVYTVLVMSVFAAMSYPDVLVLQNST